MILFIESFDLHREYSENAIPGTRDYSKYWFTNGNNGFVPGYLFGQAVRQDRSPQLGMRGKNGNANAIPYGTQKVRACWWAKTVTDPNPSLSDWMGYFCFTTGAVGSDDAIVLQLNNSGYFRITRGGFYEQSFPHQEVMSSESIEVIGSDWEYHEFIVDYTNQTAEFLINGISIIQGSFAVSQVVGTLAFGFNRPSSFGTYLDHFIVTDGERPSVGGIHAVAPTAAWDRYESGLSEQVRGNLVIDGLSYRTLTETTPNSSLSFGSADGAAVLYFLYPNDPSGGMWTTEAFDAMNAWGVCTVNHGDVGGNKSRMASLGLSVVETDSDPSGFPVIKTYPATSLVYYSGNWMKSNPLLALAGHVSDVPRDEDGEDLKIDDDGCVLFATPGTANDLFYKVGITFAEEYRSDYVDWAAVYQSGLPFESYFITGYSILGDGNKDFQSNYVSVNYENVPVGGAYLQGIWDYALDRDTGRWGTRQQVYVATGNYKHSIRRLKVRGRGKAMQIKVTSEQNKNFKINGWSVFVSGNSGL